ncbi:hypothetical protein [Polymorphospora rubra]|uniref:hypothetical protein n=1 Tax=Polymorphospora rubra TaxID=338584 RepID=UPI0033D9F190
MPAGNIGPGVAVEVHRDGELSANACAGPVKTWLRFRTAGETPRLTISVGPPASAGPPPRRRRARRTGHATLRGTAGQHRHTAVLPYLTSREEQR